MLELDADYCGQVVAGTDEAGRGPLCGPVCAAAVIWPEALTLDGLNDSKQLTEGRREALFVQVQQQAIGWAIAWCTAAEIDRYNILQASHMAMCRAVEALPVQPAHVLVDGNRVPRMLMVPATAIVKGDAKHSAIAAASILAKVARDRVMVSLDRQYPGYGLARNKGYPTAAHLAALTIQGVTPEHRRSFAPVRDRLGPVPDPTLTEQGRLEF
ncbi:ribonuclease HII [Natronospirillum operosum]|uniref:Ribonuclease HII n=1 Tax=Natronospirillum operosum TaxID=2759953 RepID=A0A4Z0WI97_9GAMM|nr:ribonuclease HII [Natronospirillum operosum]TGG95133.1 ribonuclease HII [Natronospirillum operosum]